MEVGVGSRTAAAVDTVAEEGAERAGSASVGDTVAEEGAGSASTEDTTAEEGAGTASAEDTTAEEGAGTASAADGTVEVEGRVRLGGATEVCSSSRTLRAL